jgi:ribosomal protein L12E/L44/L45/RPP1/RPP2
LKSSSTYSRWVLALASECATPRFHDPGVPPPRPDADADADADASGEEEEEEEEEEEDARTR